MENENEEFDYKKWKTLITVGIVSAVILIVVGVFLLIFIIAPDTATVLNVPYVPPIETLTPATNIPPGGTCSEVGQCVPGYFCNSVNVCTIGSPVLTNGNCVVNNQCSVNSYCSGNYTCQPGVGWLEGGPCFTNNDCQMGSNCINSICTAVLLPIFPPCTQVFVYQIMNTGILGATDLHLNSVVTLPSSPLYYNGTLPSWAGCSATGTNLVPVYIWQSSSLTFNNDFVFALSNVQPFKSGTQGYTLTNGGNPVLYVSTISASNLVPIYTLAGFNTIDGQTYHCTSPGLTILQVPMDGQIVTYSGFQDDINNGLLGNFFFNLIDLKDMQFRLAMLSHCK